MATNIVSAHTSKEHRNEVISHSAVLEDLDTLIQSRSILLHRFYVAWTRGDLTRDHLAAYATLYYPHVASFPTYLRVAAAQTADATISAELERNLHDELSSPKPHDELWLEFAEALGVDRHVVKTAPPHPAAVKMISTFTRLAGEGVASGLAALYAYESQQPEVSRQKMEGLRQRYGVERATGLGYFTVHALTDIEHRRGERDGLARCLEAGTSPRTILDAAHQALDAYWALLDGVCQQAGIPANSWGAAPHEEGAKDATEALE